MATYYSQELERIRSICYSNQDQIKTVQAVRDFMNHNFERAFDLDFLSHEFCISKYHLLRLFKRYYGQTPRQFLIDVRMAKSKALLSSGQSVSATCFAVGFESPTSFSSLFKLKFGISPSTFRKKAIFKR